MSSADPHSDHKPTRTTWERRRAVALAVRVAGIAVPLGAGMAAAVATSHLLPLPDSVLPMILRTLAVVASSVLTIRLLDAAVRRLLPLATLMQLSLLFPDQAPSRLRLAIKSTSTRKMARLVAETRVVGLSNDLTVATEQVLLLTTTLSNHDRRTRGHSERVRLYADMIGEELKLSRDDRRRLQWGALLHDLGKLTVPAEILNKKGTLDEAEWAVMRNHPESGRRMLGPLAEFLGPWASAVWHHHERLDGKGYPYGISGADLHIGAAVVAVADSFEVMTATRSYKRPMSVRDARTELTRCAGTQFHPEVVRAFLSVSVGRVRLSMGPLASVAHLPFVRDLAEVPTRIAGVMSQGVAATTGATGPAVVAGVMTVGALAGTGTLAAVAPAEPPPVVAAAAVAPPTTAPLAPVAPPTTPAIAANAVAPTPTTRPVIPAPTTTTSVPVPASAPANVPTPAETTTKTTTTTPPPTTTAPPSTTAPVSAPAQLLVSTSSNRSNATALAGMSYSTLTPIHVFVTSERSIQHVDFYLAPNANGTRINREGETPYDLLSTAGNGDAVPWILLTAGTKHVTAVVKYRNGSPTSETISATFTAG